MDSIKILLLNCLTRKTSGFSSRQWVIILVFGLTYLFAACVTSLQAPFYPAESEKKGASATEYGLVFGVFQLVVFIFSPIFGKHMNYLGAKFVFHMGVLTIGTSCFMFGFLEKINDHTTFITLSFAIRIFEAIGDSALCTAAFTITAADFPDSVATTFASLETFYGLGLIIGPSIGGLLYECGGFMLPFTVAGLCLILVALVTPFIMPSDSTMVDAEADCEGQEGFSLFTLLKIPVAALSGLTIWMSSNSIGFLNATLEPHLRQFHFSEMTVGLVFMSTGASYGISAPLWGIFIDKRCHPKYVSLCGCVLFIVAHLMIGPAVFIPSDTKLSVTLIGLVIHGVGVGAIQVSGFIWALREAIANGFPNNLTTYSVVSGLWASSLALGLFVGPSVGGFLLDQSNFRVGSLYPLFTAMLTVVIVIIGIIIHNQKYKQALKEQDCETANLLHHGIIPREHMRTSQEYHGALQPVVVHHYGTVT